MSDTAEMDTTSGSTETTSIDTTASEDNISSNSGVPSGALIEFDDDEDGKVQIKSADDVKNYYKKAKQQEKYQYKLSEKEKAAKDYYNKGLEALQKATELIDHVKGGNAEAIINHPELGPMLEKAYETRFRVLQEMQQLKETDPVAYENYVLRAQHAQIQAEQRKAKEKEEAQKKSKEAEAERERVHTLLIGILDKGGIPKVPMVARMLAYKAKAAHAAGYPIDEQELAKETAQEFWGAAGEYIDGLTDDQLLDHLGDDRRARLRKAELARYKVSSKADSTKTYEDNSPTNKDGSIKRLRNKYPF